MPATPSIMQSAPGPETIIDGVRYLYFGGTSYLGLAANPDVIESGCAALRTYGLHTATSRARFGTNPPVFSVERLAATFFGAEESFYFPSGYMANHIMVSALAQNNPAVFVDEAAHFCITEAAKLPQSPIRTFRHQDASDLASQVKGVSNVLILADAVGPASGRLAPVHDYIEAVKSCQHACLILDDAHGFGILGPNGRGLLDELGLWENTNRRLDSTGVCLYVCGTLSKALGGFGGIIPGTSQLVARLRESSHYFDGASAPDSAAAGATAKALEIVMQNPSLRARLRENTRHIRRGLNALGLPTPAGDSAHFGVSVGDSSNMQRIHVALKTRGILLPYVSAYSGTPPEGLLRFAVFANHSREQIDRLIAELGAIL
jgi:8-amino-7-oxononanoate synthase